MAQIVADSIREVYDYPGTFAETLAPHAARFGLRRNDGLALLDWLLGLVGGQETERWMDEARASNAHGRSDHVEDGGWSRAPAVTLGMG